jgi:hypothetical protein
MLYLVRSVSVRLIQVKPCFSGYFRLDQIFLVISGYVTLIKVRSG